MRFFVCFAFASCLAGAPPKLRPVQEQYTKFEYRVPMRDGVKLFTAVYVPKDSGPNNRYPILFLRTPYAVRPYGADQYRETLGPSEWAQDKGYIFVYQDVRGRYMSEGEFEQVRPHNPAKTGKQIDESSDTHDSIAWLLGNVGHHNGNVGMWGISYPGFYATMGMVDAHPALKAVSPQAPVGDWFIGDDWRHNGAFYLAHAARWMYMNSREGANDPKVPRSNPEYESPDGYSLFLGMGTLEEINERLLKNKVPYWRELMEHSTYDAFWQARDVRPHLKNVRPAVLTVGGWFDAEDLFGTLETYKRNEKQSPNGVNLLVMGPWSHGQWASGKGERLGDVAFHQATGEYYRERIEFPFFERYLRGESQAKPLAEAHVFETGANQWRTFDSWPPRQTVDKSYHLSHEGRLAGNPPSRGGYEEYVSDPARPVPFVPYIANTMTVEHMLDDQRFAAMRPDVLVFQTDPLEEDLTLAGPLEATLHISSTGTDADFVVKLIDVYPNDYPNPDPNPKGLKMGGFQQLVRGEPFRAKFRKSFEKPEPLVPGQVDKLSYTLPDVFHTFRRGHRMMVQVQSSWFPLVDRNPQKFMDIPKAKRSDFVKATQRVYVGPVAGSSLKVRVLSARPEATLR
ncbi:MAG: CocE/NonD family hydrolase [Acidobacteria bacterium]|jgi:hypothetical protein|nr:CocE/NonD family hydrolase [Bryobacteraceae bacterium CoA2 C42]